ncbi:MAG TPA: HDOD domain-containing protein [Steroidobacteraceae bacterium]|nr:HDOD domain-containing protein [Steroidobacteraceae bacterium]
MPRHILLVGDDARRLQDPLPLPGTEQWIVTLAATGSQALLELERRPQDVVIADVDACAADAAPLLGAISERWPSTSRIALCGSLESSSRAYQLPFPAAHQYIYRESAAGEFHEAVARCLRLQDLLSQPGLRSVIASVHRLPPRPRTFARLQVMMSHKNVTPKKICAVIEADAAITAKLLQLANCAMFHERDRIRSIEQALTRLGFLAVRNLVMCAEVLTGWQRATRSALDLDSMQAHVQRVARVTAALTAGSPCSDEAVLAAFLHDIGYWVLVQERPAQLDQAAALAVSRDIPMQEAERCVLGTSHAEIGAYLLGLWGMSNTLVEAIAHHHTPELVGVTRFNTLSALALALALSGTDDSDAFSIPPRRNGVVGQAFFEQLEGIPFDWVDAERLAMTCLAEVDS